MTADRTTARGEVVIDLAQSTGWLDVTSGKKKSAELTPGLIFEKVAGGFGLRLSERAGSAAAARVAPPLITLRLAGELIRERTPTQWLVNGWIECGAFCFMNGATDSGKSFIGLSLATAIAAATGDWFGCATRSGPVVYLAGEGQRGIGRRLRGLSDHHGISLENAPLFVSDKAFPANSAVDAYAAAEVIERAVDQCGMPPVAIFWDTLARHYNGDENSSQEVGQLIANVSELGARWGAASVLIHHSGHGAPDRGRGSSALRAAADAEFLVKRESRDRPIELRCVKMKDADEPAPMAFELVGYALPWLREDGTPDTTAILRPHAGGVPAPSESSAPKPAAGKNQNRALEVLRAMQDQQRRTLEASGYDGAQARVLTADWRDRCALDRNRWGETFKGLQDRGAIEIDGPHVRLVEP
ncbi:MAG: AAA family ATPase [Pseudomonadota bacterium]|jgi:hypothetical protein